MVWVVKICELYAVIDGERTIKTFKTNREAWKFFDEMSNEAVSRQESVNEWMFKQSLN